MLQACVSLGALWTASNCTAADQRCVIEMKENEDYYGQQQFDE